MNKKALLTAMAVIALVSMSPAFADGGDSKVKTAAQNVGKAVMWGPKKIGSGLKAMGNGMKKMFHKGS